MTRAVTSSSTARGRTAATSQGSRHPGGRRLAWLMWALAALPIPADGDDSWTRFRGPNGAGIAADASIPAPWVEADYSWQVPLPGIGHSSPVIWQDRVLITTADPQTAERSILCLAAADGRLLWRRDHPSKPYPQHPGNSFAAATPVVDEAGVVWTWTTPEQLLVVAHSLDGKELWKRDLGAFVGANGSGGSPILVRGMVIIANEQDDVRHLTRVSSGREDRNAAVGSSAIVALDRHSGETRWSRPRDTVLASYATPCVRMAADGREELIMTSTRHGIYALDVQTGVPRWEISGMFEDRCVGSPVLAGDLVLASYGHGVHGSLLVAARGGRNGRAGPETIAYEVKKAVPLVPTPVVVGEFAFLWADTGVVTCLRAATSEVVWRKRVEGEFYGSPVCVAGRLYCIARNGDVVVIAAAPQYELLARVPLGEDSHATPAVADGTMYLRTHSRLFSLGARRPPVRPQ